MVHTIAVMLSDSAEFLRKAAFSIGM